MAGFSRKQTIESFTGYVKEIPDRAIIVGCHCDTDYKMKLTNDLLIKIRGKFKDDIFLVVASHLPVTEEIQELCDYFVYNKNNPVINLDILTSTTENSSMLNELWRANGVMERIKTLRKNHSYAHHLLIRDAFHVCMSNNVSFVHYMNYDSPEKCLSEIGWHLTKLDEYDGVFYDYHHKQYYNTEFFSMTTKAFDKFLSHIISYEQWESDQSFDTEVNYSKFLKTANIFCEDIFDPDVSDIIGSVSFGSEVNRKGTPDILKNVVGNFTVIPYERDGKIIINNSYTGYNDSKHEKHIRWESFDENLNQINFYDAVVSKNNWVDYICPENCKFVKIYIDLELKSFFDITNKKNIGHLV
tara:strand:+ start:980 stop:2047 length:1068 start_codon:yes stop_codon:yes gene_type:complete